MSYNTHFTLLNKFRLCCALTRALPDRNGVEISEAVFTLDKLGRALQSRALSGTVEGIDVAKYEAKTEKLEQKLIRLAQGLGFEFIQWDAIAPQGASLVTGTYTKGLYFALQTDPRGWPIKLSIDGCEYVLGGR